jgi:hypothetical protein
MTRASGGRSSGRTRIGGRFDSDGAEEVEPNDEFLSSIGESGTDWTSCGCLPAATAAAAAGSFCWVARWSSEGAELGTPLRECTDESSSRPRRQFTEAESVEIPLGMPSREPEMALLRASTNQFSDLEESSRREPREEEDSGLAGKRKSRIREVREDPPPEEEAAMRSYSSTRLSRSSSVETEMRESRSSLGSWYLSVKGRPPSSDRERRAWTSASVAWRSTATIRVSPPR